MGLKYFFCNGPSASALGYKQLAPNGAEKKGDIREI